jgi:hypothetical protein
LVETAVLHQNGNAKKNEKTKSKKKKPKKKPEETEGNPDETKFA